MKNILFVTDKFGFECWRNFCSLLPGQPSVWMDDEIANKALIPYNGLFFHSRTLETTIIEFKTIEDCMFFTLKFANE
jgi:hypothetical protein